MHTRVARAAVLTALLAGGALYQGCTITLPYGPPVYVDLNGNFPHFDGDGEDSLLDRWFGFDDDD